MYIIYGGTGGIGAALARRLARSGARLHLVARDPARLKALAQETGASFTAGDVLDAELFARVAADAPGPLAGLAYAVGSINLKPLSKLTESDFLADFRLNALGAAAAVRAALPGLKAGEGTPAVVLFSTVAVQQGFPAHASVAMAKGAVEGLTRALAAELAPKLRVNAVAPSLTRTPLAAALTSNEQMAGAIAQLHPLQRLGDPEDVASLAQYLLSGEAGWITGQIIAVDGGRSTLRNRG
ncbi:SDR family NAD(P)-dependent oxidoreductase [Ancylobacter lacus]|uniref:SDR family NAD(P)-dependent oxidoreductase n=1 Tax=Ancylobacter lacus TaxID=2579970 RepID=UPI001BCF0866|nr:SDR family oxidoreductase [Ancylobacter lacus]MBS7538093.1 SDR family oxidoreductase [Ancylobacter lacus]